MHGNEGAVALQFRLPQLVAMAEDLAQYLLAEEPERLAHSAAVARRAQLLAAATEAERAPLLVAAAWLHDIGYRAPLRETGFHPVDGARYLRRSGWPTIVCDLVAHHSGSRYVAAIRGLSDQLAPFAFVEDPVTDALTVADQTAGTSGRPMTVHDRIQEMLTRHGPDSSNAKAHPHRGPYLIAAARRVAERMAEAGVQQHGIFTSIEVDQRWHRDDR